MKRNIITSVILVLLIAVAAWLTPVVINTGKASQKKQVQSAATVRTQNKDEFSYKGEEGKDALTLLKQKAQVNEKQPGFVLSINGRRADASSKEFWSFYVNGKMAEVGAADYVTKNTDYIVWKVENYK